MWDAKSLWYECQVLVYFFNTLPWGREETHDCSPMRCWGVTSFFISLRDVLHMSLSACSCFKVIDSLMQVVRSQVTNKQTGPDPLFLEPEDCNKVTTRSDTLSVYLQLQSWLYVGVFCKKTIFCASYMRIHVLMSLIIVTMKVWTVTVTSPQLVHVSNCDLLLVHWPPYNFHTHFSSNISRQFL